MTQRLSASSARNRRRRWTVETLEPRRLLAADVRINELMADNDNTLLDGDGASSDWIELFNAGDAPEDLTGWFLTDDPAVLTKWAFPAVQLAAGQYLTVFASGQIDPNYVDAGGNLHTTFNLSAAGEYLALVRPDGTTVADEFAPYPALPEDVSYGPSLLQNQFDLLGDGDAAKLLVPTQADQWDSSWHQGAFDDSIWADVSIGVGFEQSDALPPLPDPTPGSTLPDPVGHWRIGEATGETSGTTLISEIDPSHNGVVVGTPTWRTLPGGDIPPVPTGSTAAMGYGEGGQHNTGYEGVLGTAARTVSAWVKLRFHDTDEHHSLVSWGNNSNGQRFTFRIDEPNGDRMRLEVAGGSATANTPLTIDQWHHVAVVMQPGDAVHDVEIYLDGQLDGAAGNWFAQSSTNRAINTANNGNNDVTIAGLRHSPDYNGNVDLDEVRIYDQAFSPAQIRTLMQSSLELAAHWQFDTGTGTTVVDRMGAYDGTLVGIDGPAWTAADPPRVDSDFALDFDGIDDYVATSFDGVAGAAARTVAFWVRSDAPADGAIVAWGDDTVDGARWHIGLDTTGALATDVGGGQIIGTANLADGRWHHVVSLLPGGPAAEVGDVLHYVDGVLDPASQVTPHAVQTDTAGAAAQAVTIGRHTTDGTEHYFHGQLDEVRIYAGALDVKSIARLAEPRDTTPPWAYWPLDDGAGFTADERIGQADGTLLDVDVENADLQTEPIWQADVPAVLPNTHSLLFDGVDDYVATPAVGIGGGDPRTVAFWVKSTDNTSIDAFVVWGNSSVNGAKWHVRINTSAANGTLGAIRTEVGGGYMIGTTDITDGQWHHVVSILPDDSTPNAEDIIHYIDGVLQGDGGSAAHAIDTQAGGDTINLGIRIQGTARSYFAGSLADVAVWNGELSAEQVAALADGSLRPDQVVGFANLIQSDIEPSMHDAGSSALLRAPFTVDDTSLIDRLSLRLNFDDGFVGYLNGVEVASANAPIAPDWQSTATGQVGYDVLEPQVFDLSDHVGLLLQSPAENLLAIHGLNAAIDDPDFLLRPELEGVQVTEQGRRFMLAPTPSAQNLGGIIDFVADTTFSHDRGYYDAPFNVTISTATPDAAIYYTTDSSTPDPANPTATLYTAPVPIATTTVLRAVALKDEYGPTNVDTQTYVFLDDVLQQPAQPAGFPTQWVGNSTIAGDYEMDPTIVNDAVFGPQLLDSMRSHPTISLTMHVDDWFDPQTGIYSNSEQKGDFWERETSVELFDFPHGDDLQVNAGIKLQGNASRWPSRPKHNMRLVFRDEYGPGRLEFPLFAGTDIESFNGIVLRGGNGDSWINPSVSQPLYVRDEWHRDMQVAMGHQSSLQTHAHIYINGLYWGLFHVFERVEDDFMAEHFGGEPEQYDVVKDIRNTGGQVEAISGTTAPWLELLDRVGENMADATNYDAAIEMLDLENFVDYLLINFYSINKDWDQSNWRAGRNREGDGKFRFFSWDAERSDLNNGPVTGDVTGKNNQNYPTYIHQRLTANEEYRLFFADRVQKHLFNDGALTPAAAAAVFNARAAEVLPGLIAESARWGDTHRDPPYTIDTWQTYLDNMNNGFFPQRTDLLLGQLNAKDLYPDFDAPDFAQFGGEITPGFTLAMSDPANPPVAEHVLYYTTNGADPRLPGGAVNSTDATAYNTPEAINQTTTVKARIYNTSTQQWSALTEALFTVEVPLRVSEVMYNPPAPTVDEINAGYTDNDDFEFVELVNTSPTDTIDLEGIAFSDGITFTFGPGTLAPGERVLVVRDAAAFAERYDTTGMQIAGEYRAPDGSNKLSNNGETLALVDAGGAPIQSFRFNDGNSWPQPADGDGSSLETIDVEGNLDEGASWYASPQWGGSPAALASAAVIERFLFYDGSAFDTVDDDAIATDKQALLLGQTATAANVSSYAEGINGLILDVARPTDASQIDETDFIFLTGNVDDLGAWTPLADPPTVTIRPGEGRGTSDRVVLTWAAGEAATNTWLQVTMNAASPETGLYADDVFHFGSAVGETFNAPTNLLTTSADVIAIRDNPRGAGNRADVLNPHDINRDRLVNAADQLLARNHATGPFSASRLITPTLPPVAPPEAEGAAATPSVPLLSASRASDGPGDVETPGATGWLSTPGATGCLSASACDAAVHRFANTGGQAARATLTSPTPLDLVARARALRRSINDVAAPQDTASHEKLSTNVLRPLLGTL